MTSLQHKILRDNNIAATEPRKLLLSILMNSEQPLSAADILPLATLTDRATIYRGLALLEERDVIQKIHIHGESYYVINEITKPKQFFVCNSCGVVDGLEIPEFSRGRQEAEKQTGYLIEKQSTILHGLCNHCQ